MQVTVDGTTVTTPGMVARLTFACSMSSARRMLRGRQEQLLTHAADVMPFFTDGDGTAVYTGAPGCGYGYSYPYYGGYSYPYYGYYPYGGKGLCMSIVLVCQHHSLTRGSHRAAREHENSLPCPCQELYKL